MHQKKLYYLISFLFIFISFTNTNGYSQTNCFIKAYDLRCEYQKEPICIDIQHPRFFWKLKAIDSTKKGLRQKTYRLIVSSSAEKLNTNDGDQWDSGLTESSKSIQIVYKGKSLQPFHRYYWKVCVKDQEEQISEWSATASFKTSALHEKDWQDAKWITLGKDNRDSKYISRIYDIGNEKFKQNDTTFASPLFRRDIVISRNIKSAFSYVCGLGYHVLSVNGQRVGTHVLDPAQTSYDSIVFYVTQDITAFLKNGKNSIGLMLGSGFYGQNIAFVKNTLSYGNPLARVLIRIEYTDGTYDNIISGNNWKCNTGPILFDNVYAGETYDARKEIENWNTVMFDDASWPESVITPPPCKTLRAQYIPPIRPIKELTPVRIFPSDHNTWIIDLGVNISGWMKIKVKESQGKEIRLTFAENLYPNQKQIDTRSTGYTATGFVQTNIYICKGNESEVWEPQFTYHGFRYVEVEGLSKKPDIRDFTGILAHTDFEKDGEFICSDTLLNKMYDVSMRTILDNRHSVPEDCPHREKCGWTGDAHTCAETDIFNFNSAAFITKYMYDIKCNLGKEPITYVTRERVSSKLPTMISPGKRLCLQATPDWGAAMVLMPWNLYQFYGDTVVMNHLYTNMKEWVNYNSEFVKNGVLPSGLGDWCAPMTEKEKDLVTGECKPAISGMLMYLETLRKMALIAHTLNDVAFEKTCLSLFEKFKNEFNLNVLKPIEKTDLYSYGSQTADVLSLKYNIVPQDKKEAVIKALVYNITTLHNGHQACGVFGLKHLFHILSDNGFPDIAYKTLTNSEFPGHGWWLKRGLTVWPEAQKYWAEKDTVLDCSYNHAFQSGFATWFHNTILGIRIDEEATGMEHFILKPTPPQHITNASGSYNSINGIIKSSWKKENNKFKWRIEIPVNTFATVSIPVKTNGLILINRQDIKTIKSAYFMNGFATVNLGSGNYQIISEINY